MLEREKEGRERGRQAIREAGRKEGREWLRVLIVDNSTRT